MRQHDQKHVGACGWALTCAAVMWLAPSAALAAEEKTVSYVDEEGEISDPTDVVTDVNTSFAQPGALFPDFDLPGRIPYEQLKQDIFEQYGLRFGFSYQQIYQNASHTIPGARYDSAMGGWAAGEAVWSLFDRGGENEGRLVARVGWRDPIGNHSTPASFGATQLGSIWSNYEFTTWGGGFRLEDLFWEQTFGGDEWMIRVGNQIPTTILNFSRFKDARVSYTSSPFAFHENIPLPTFGFGTAVRWRPDGSGLYFVATVNDMNGEPNGKGFNWSTVQETQFFYGFEVGKRWVRANGEFDHLHLNLFYADDRSTRMPDVLPNKSGAGFRVYGEKQVGDLVYHGGYTYNEAEGGGISGSFAAHTGTAGVAYLNPFGIRGEVAVGGMWSRPINNIFPGFSARDQYGIETYWRVLMTPNLTVTPGIQLIFDPAFNLGEDFVAVPHVKFRVVF